MQRNLLGFISTNFEIRIYLLIIHPAFVKLKKMEIQRCSSSNIFRLQESLWFSYGRVLHNSVLESVINMKLVIVTKIGLNESCKIVWVVNISLLYFLLGMLCKKEMFYCNWFSSLLYNTSLELSRLNRTIEMKFYSSNFSVRGRW
jgi:hypothetical protein